MYRFGIEMLFVVAIENPLFQIDSLFLNGKNSRRYDSNHHIFDHVLSAVQPPKNFNSTLHDYNLKRHVQTKHIAKWSFESWIDWVNLKFVWNELIWDTFAFPKSFHVEIQSLWFINFLLKRFWFFVWFNFLLSMEMLCAWKCWHHDRWFLRVLVNAILRSISHHFSTYINIYLICVGFSVFSLFFSCYLLKIMKNSTRVFHYCVSVLSFSQWCRHTSSATTVGATILQCIDADWNNIKTSSLLLLSCLKGIGSSRHVRVTRATLEMEIWWKKQNLHMHTFQLE